MWCWEATTTTMRCGQQTGIGPQWHTTAQNIQTTAYAAMVVLSIDCVVSSSVIQRSIWQPYNSTNTLS
jgi:hypothetical protein